MRVALLSRSAHPLHPPGGLERAVYHLARHLRDHGVEAVLVTRPGTEPGEFPGEVVGVPYRSLPGLRHGRVLDRALHYPGFALRAGEVAAALVRSGRVELVHAQGLMALGYGRLRRKDPSLRAPLVMNPQGMEEHKAGGLKGLALARLRALSREAARLSDRVIATDEATRAEVPRLLRVDPARVVVLPNGIDADEIGRLTPGDPGAAVEATLPGLGRAFPLYLSVGRLEAYKGFSDVLLAFRELHGRGALPPRWAWVVVGRGPERGRLARRISRSAEGLDSHVHLVGRVGDALLHALYARADIFVHATRFEGSSLVTLEAMAHGLPVIATRAGGIPDKVVDGVTGRLVEPGDAAGLGRGLLGLATDAALRREMGQQGLARALALFDWPRLAERTILLYRELLEARP